jgi:YidC/Oxa1 family membrane protein insertase
VSLLNPLADLVAWAIIHLHIALGAVFGPNTGLAWGLSIAVLVIIIRLLLVPLFVKQVHAQRKMAQHAPQIAELRKKYKNDKQRLNEETMKFYKENGVNPLAGCLPMIPQMIVFFALFYVLRAIAEWTPAHYVNGHLVPATPAKYGLTVPILESAQKATIFGVHLGDKLLFAHPSPPFHVAIVIALTVIVSASTTFMTVRQSSKRGLMNTNVDPDNPMAQSQKYMMYIIPFFSLTGLYWQYGLVLYWVTTNLWTLGQQYFMFRNWEPVVAAGTATGAVVRATQSSMRSNRPSSGTARPSSGTARPASGGTASGGTASGGAKAPSGGARNGASNGRADTAAARDSAAAGTRPRPASRSSQTATAPAGTTGPNGVQNGAEKRGLLRLGRQKPEPEPEPEVPAPKVVRQQPARQARSKRSGKR